METIDMVKLIKDFPGFVSGRALRVWRFPVDKPKGIARVVVAVRCEKCWKWGENEGLRLEETIICDGCDTELSNLQMKEEDYSDFVLGITKAQSEISLHTY